MYNKNKYLSILLMMFLFLLVGCNETITENKYLIKFDTHTNEKIESIEISEPTNINLPKPQKKGYTFEGWYPSEEFLSGTMVTEETTIGKNITLHAKWEPIKITLNLDLQGGYLLEEVNTEIEIYTNEFYDFPRVYLDEHLFLGWFVGDEKVNNKTEFLEDTTITAKYKALSELEPEYNITLNLNGGAYYIYDDQVEESYKRFYDWDYKDYLDSRLNNLIAEFCYDFYSFVQGGGRLWDYFSWNMFDITESKLIGSNGFCGSLNYFNKWKWLFEYLGSVASEENKPYFAALLNGEYTSDASTYAIEQAAIRIELAGFLNGYQMEKTIGKKNQYTVVSADYSNNDILYGFVKDLNPTTYITGVGTTLLTPFKDDCDFVGWYDNPDFKGEKITEIMHNDFGDKVYYAKWN